MKVYLSSTYLDLRKQRESLGVALRKAQYHVVMMEEYVARDESVEIAVIGDVSACDVYVGLVAQRYGYIPIQNNPLGKSITELEYDAAGSQSIPRLTFLSKEDAVWVQEEADADRTRISQFRSRLTPRCSAYFSDSADLMSEVLAALRVSETTKFAKQIEAIDVMKEAQQFGPSYMMNIINKFKLLLDTDFIEIQMGPTPWWNTRVHLISALSQEFGRTREFVFVDSDKRFLAMAPPTELRRRLAVRWPRLEIAYTMFRDRFRTLKDIEEQLWQYPNILAEAWGWQEEREVEVLLPGDIQRNLGVVQDAEIIDVSDQGQVALQREVLGRRSPFVALLREDRLEGFIEVAELSKLVARKALERVQSG